MKKIQILWISVLVWILQSCSIQTNTLYHNDATQSSQMDINMKELMAFSKSMLPDSANTENKKIDDLKKMPKVWKSIFDIVKEDSAKSHRSMDSLQTQVLKKIFMKGNVSADEKELESISIKWDRLSRVELEELLRSNKNTKNSLKEITSSNKALNNWDGKTLIIDTEKLTGIDELGEMMKEKGQAVPEEPVYKTIKTKKGKRKVLVKPKETPEEAAKKIAEQMKSMMKLFNMNLKNTLRFENKIIKIEGKHDWVKQIDDRTIQIDIDSKNMYETKDLKEKDPKVIITTE